MDDEIVALHGASKPYLLTCALARVPARGLFLDLAFAVLPPTVPWRTSTPPWGNLLAYEGVARNDNGPSAGPRIGLKLLLVGERGLWGQKRVGPLHDPHARSSH